MNLQMLKSFRVFQTATLFILVLGFLGLTTAIYNPVFHASLHDHHECEKQTESEKSNNAGAHLNECNLLSHVAVNTTLKLPLVKDVGEVFESYALNQTSSYLSHFHYGFSGRAPPFFS